MAVELEEDADILGMGVSDNVGERFFEIELEVDAGAAGKVLEEGFFFDFKLVREVGEELLSLSLHLREEVVVEVFVAEHVRALTRGVSGLAGEGVDAVGEGFESVGFVDRLFDKFSKESQGVEVGAKFVVEVGGDSFADDGFVADAPEAGVEAEKDEA